MPRNGVRPAGVLNPKLGTAGDEAGAVAEADAETAPKAVPLVWALKRATVLADPPKLKPAKPTSMTEKGTAVKTSEVKGFCELQVLCSMLACHAIRWKTLVTLI